MLPHNIHHKLILKVKANLFVDLILEACLFYCSPPPPSNPKYATRRDHLFQGSTCFEFLYSKISLIWFFNKKFKQNTSVFCGFEISFSVFETRQTFPLTFCYKVQRMGSSWLNKIAQICCPFEPIWSYLSML